MSVERPHLAYSSPPPPTAVDLTVDVTEAAGLGESLQTRVTVRLPDPAEMTPDPIVCFGFPGGGYSRGYFTFDMPGATGGGQAGWHARRGWVFVACDHLYVGESSTPSEPGLISFEVAAATNVATVEAVTAALRKASVAQGFPAVPVTTRVGIGQSMGGCLTIVAQGQRAPFDAIAVLGYSARHTVLAMPPGTPTGPASYVPRGSLTTRMMSAPPTAENPSFTPRSDGLPLSTWGFHYDDEPPDIVAADMADYPLREGRALPWASATMPPCAVTMMSPGVVAPEAAAITVPVLVAVGERDVCPDPRSEPLAYAASPDVTVFVCPRMSHMHNFASTREVFWRRIESWAKGATGRT